MWSIWMLVCLSGMICNSGVKNHSVMNEIKARYGVRISELSKILYSRLKSCLVDTLSSLITYKNS